MPSADVARHRAYVPAGTSRVLNIRALVIANRRLGEVVQAGLGHHGMRRTSRRASWP
jgi:hypothetical protein